VCTISWLPGPGGYLLCFNRDENRARRPGLPPALEHSNGLDLLAPTDADAGGTWIGVNSAGVTVCLANLYGQASRPPLAPISRGVLVRQLITLAHLGQVEDALGSTSLEVYRPFTIVAVEPDRPARIWGWNGEQRQARTQSEPGLLVTSSAVDQSGAELERRRQFAELLSGDQLSAAALTALHASHRPVRGGHSICMHRTDAQTVSLTRVEVTTDTIAMAYSDGSPCHTPLGTPLMAMRRELRYRD
jgi:uncharacterized protein with NRDE domain